MKSQQLALFRPVDRQFKRKSHQLLGGELRRILAVDDGGDNVRCQQGQTQEPGNVTRVTRSWLAIAWRVTSVLFVRHALDIMGASDDPQQAGIG